MSSCLFRGVPLVGFLRGCLGLATAAFGLAEAVAVAAGFQDVAAVGQPVQGGSGEAFAAEDLRPVLERLPSW